MLSILFPLLLISQVWEKGGVGEEKGRAAILKIMIHQVCVPWSQTRRLERGQSSFFVSSGPTAGREDGEPGGLGQQVRQPELRGFLLGRTVDRYAKSEVEDCPSLPPPPNRGG